MAGESSEALAPAPAVDVRASILASLDALPGDDDASPDVAEAEPALEEAPADEVEAAPEDDEEDNSTEDDDEPAKDADPETQKRLDTVRRAERRSRVALERERAEFTTERQKWQTQVDKVSEFEGLARRAKYDPAAVLRALGVGDDDFEIVAHAIYGESKAASADPKQKAQAQARLQQREKDDKLTATEKRMADLEAKIERQQQETAAAAEAANYIGQLHTATAKFPLTAHMLKADPEDTNAAFVSAYERLAKNGKTPKPADVVAEYDKRERARLKRIGIDPDLIAKTVKAPAKVAAKVAPKINGTAPALQSREEILAELDAL